MPEFLTLLSPPDAILQLLNHMPAGSLAYNPGGIETIDTAHALGRVVAKNIHAQIPLPSFPRSTVDGFAVRAADTFGSSESLPAYLRLGGEVYMGVHPAFSLPKGHCALIHTGGMLPEGADAVIMVEHTQMAGSDEVEILRAVAVGENILKIGEDVAEGELVIGRGTRLRPAEIGGLMALGETFVSVVRQPVVGILSTGDEVVSPYAELKIGQVRDVNTYTLSALIEQNGGEAVSYGILSDNKDVLRAAAERALKACDMVILTAGSSASTRDLTVDVIGNLGKPGVLAHGLNVRPGKPTILAVCDGKVVIGLPGNPVSALTIAGLVVVPVLEKLQGIAHRLEKPYLVARLTLNLPSQAGREDWIPVRLVNAEGEIVAEPVFGKSNLIFSLSRADGLILIPADTTGFAAGSMVKVFLFE